MMVFSHQTYKFTDGINNVNYVNILLADEERIYAFLPLIFAMLWPANDSRIIRLLSTEWQSGYMYQ